MATTGSTDGHQRLATNQDPTVQECGAVMFPLHVVTAQYFCYHTFVGKNFGRRRFKCRTAVRLFRYVNILVR